MFAHTRTKQLEIFRAYTDPTYRTCMAHGVLCIGLEHASFTRQHCMNELLLLTAGGMIFCGRCQALSKRTKNQCGAPAMKGKRVCRFHGGRSTGPTTQVGRDKCAAAKTVHGQSTRQLRARQSIELQRLVILEEIGRSVGLITGPRSRGRKPGLKLLR